MTENLAYTVKEAADLCGLSVDMVYELCRQGQFPHIRVSERRIIVPRRRLEAWLNGGLPPLDRQQLESLLHH
jgi:excisionase family DNA binding protein